MKRLLLGAVLLAGGAANAQTATYTLTDVAKHATQADCWMVLNSNKVYNVTAFLAIHPAGAAVMLPYCGKDGTPGFASVPHSSNAVALEATYFIGNLVSAPLPIAVSLAPTNATLNVGATEQFTPTITNSTAGVAWTVSPPALGTIGASGLFTAVSAGQGTVTATSMQDSSKSASATVTVNATQPPPSQAITVTISPSAVTLNTGAKKQFTARVTNSTQGVTWSMKGSIGTIDQNGVLTAAMTAGNGAVVATSIADPTKSSAAEVSVTTVNCPGRHAEDDHVSQHVSE
jgi:uncharacterized protein YjdB